MDSALGTHSFKRALDHHHQLVGAFLEKMSFDSVQVANGRQQIQLRNENSHWCVVGEKVMSPCGKVVFDSSKITMMQVEFRQHSNQLSVWIMFIMDSCLELTLPYEQSSDFWALFKLLESETDTAYIKPQIYDDHCDRCACCKKRAEEVRTHTSDHPIALLLAQHVADQSKLEVEIGAETCHLCLYDTFEDQFAEDGVVYLSGNSSAQLYLPSIHGIQLLEEPIDGEKWVKLNIFNSFGDLIFALGALSDQYFNTWRKYLRQSPDFS